MIPSSSCLQTSSSIPALVSGFRFLVYQAMRRVVPRLHHDAIAAAYEDVDRGVVLCQVPRGHEWCFEQSRGAEADGGAVGDDDGAYWCAVQALSDGAKGVPHPVQDVIVRFASG